MTTQEPSFAAVQAHAKSLGIKPLRGLGIDRQYLLERIAEKEEELRLKQLAINDQKERSPSPRSPRKRSLSPKKDPLSSLRRNLSFSQLFNEQSLNEVEVVDQALHELELFANAINRSNRSSTISYDAYNEMIETLFADEETMNNLSDQTERLLGYYDQFNGLSEHLPTLLRVLSEEKNNGATGILFALDMIDPSSISDEESAVSVIPFVRTATQARIVAPLISWDRLRTLMTSTSLIAPLSAIGVALTIIAKENDSKRLPRENIDTQTVNTALIYLLKNANLIAELVALPNLGPGALFDAIVDNGTPEQLGTLLKQQPLLYSAELGYRVIKRVVEEGKTDEQRVIDLLGALVGAGYFIDPDERSLMIGALPANSTQWSLVRSWLSE